MRKIILTLVFCLISIISFSQSTVKTGADEFGNIVQIENQIETTCFSICDHTAMFSVNNGKVGLLNTKYVLSMPSVNKITDKYMDWKYEQNQLNLDEKNLIKLYNALKNKTDVKISGAKVFASNKFAHSYRVSIEINVKIYESFGKSYTRIYMYQRSYMDQKPLLNQAWTLSEEDAQNLINVFSKYIK